MTVNELKALISLLDDPDVTIFNEVEHKLISCGPEILPLLEQSWEESFDLLIHMRIENIVQRIQYEQVVNDLQLWKLHGQDDLLEGLVIINRYQYPNINENDIHVLLAELRRDTWYHLMYDMTPLEKVRLLNNMLFREFGLSGNTTDYHAPQNSFISKVLETKKGNPISLACIYSILAQKLDIPIYGINLPKHFVLAYMDDENKDQVLFYINPFNRGQVMNQGDIHSFLKQLNLPPAAIYAQLCGNIDIIRRVLKNLIGAYEHVDNLEKSKEVRNLLEIIDQL